MLSDLKKAEKNTQFDPRLTVTASELEQFLPQPVLDQLNGYEMLRRTAIAKPGLAGQAKDLWQALTSFKFLKSSKAGHYTAQAADPLAPLIEGLDAAAEQEWKLQREADLLLYTQAYFERALTRLEDCAANPQQANLQLENLQQVFQELHSYLSEEAPLLLLDLKLLDQLGPTVEEAQDMIAGALAQFRNSQAEQQFLLSAQSILWKGARALKDDADDYRLERAQDGLTAFIKDVDLIPQPLSPEFLNSVMPLMHQGQTALQNARTEKTSIQQALETVEQNLLLAQQQEKLSQSNATEISKFSQVLSQNLTAILDLAQSHSAEKLKLTKSRAKRLTQLAETLNLVPQQDNQDAKTTEETPSYPALLSAATRETSQLLKSIQRKAPKTPPAQLAQLLNSYNRIEVADNNGRTGTYLEFKVNPDSKTLIELQFGAYETDENGLFKAIKDKANSTTIRLSRDDQGLVRDLQAQSYGQTFATSPFEQKQAILNLLKTFKHFAQQQDFTNQSLKTCIKNLDKNPLNQLLPTLQKATPKAHPNTHPKPTA